MKSISSLGGPFIAIDKAKICFWGGIDRLEFFKEAKSSTNDYEYLCFESNEIDKCVFGVAKSQSDELLFITYPSPIVVVEVTASHIYIAQIDGSELGWSEDELSGADFEKSLEWRDGFEITMKRGKTIFFDAARVDSDFEDDSTIEIDIEGGIYRCDWVEQSWIGKSRMKLFRIIKQSK